MTVCRHFDDLKISHRDEEMVTAFTVDMANIYKENTTILRCRVHDYLGIELYFGTCKGTLITSMIKYLKKYHHKHQVHTYNYTSNNFGELILVHSKVDCQVFSIRNDHLYWKYCSKNGEYYPIYYSHWGNLPGKYQNGEHYKNILKRGKLPDILILGHIFESNWV